MNEYEFYKKAIERAKNSGVDLTNYTGIVAFLEKEIDRYRDKIGHLENRIDELYAELHFVHKDLHKAMHETVQENTLEAVQDNTAAKIIKALSDNEYKTITFTFYKE